jgi:MarR family transcriptional regulator, organic hydroperoxide resistance regulator
VVTESSGPASEPAPAWSAVLAVQRAAHASVHLLSARLADLGLTGSEINALANLADGRRRTVSALAAAAGVRATTMTSVLDRLEQRGLVRRGPAAGDRRAVLVALTETGEQAAAAIGAAIAGLERSALAGLDAAAIGGLRAGLDALAKAMP